MSTPLTQAERAAILADLRAGATVQGTARRHGRAPSTVSKLGKTAGLDLEQSRTKKAHAARRDYAQTARLALLNKVFDRVEDLLPSCHKAQEVAQLATALAIVIDKRRLEDGEATSRAEVSTSGARDRIASRLDELAERRREKAALG